MSRSPARRRALGILFDTYWSPRGWKRERSTPEADRAYAKAEGVMFDAVTMDHDEAIQRLSVARSRVTPALVARSFLASLGSRHLEGRSALGSLAVARHFPAHSYRAGRNSHACLVCGRIRSDPAEVDLNVLNFERHKWGGVRHTDPVYVAFDLEQCLVAERGHASASDLAIWADILRVLESLPADSKLGAVERALADCVAGNSAERRTLLGILSYAGLLQPAGRSGFFHQFTDWSDREERSLNKDDWPYPLRWWTPKDGIDQDALNFWFAAASQSSDPSLV